MNTSQMFRLDATDLVKALITALLAGAAVSVFTILNGIFTAPDFDVFMVDWALLGHSLINAAIVGAEGGFAGYIGKNFFSNSSGAFLGRYGGAK